MAEFSNTGGGFIAGGSEGPNPTLSSITFSGSGPHLKHATSGNVVINTKLEGQNGNVLENNLSGFWSIAPAGLFIGSNGLRISGKLELTDAANTMVSLDAKETNWQSRIRGNRSAADANPDVILDGQVTRTAGILTDIRNNGSSRFRVDFNGDFGHYTGARWLSADGSGFEVGDSARHTARGASGGLWGLTTQGDGIGFSFVPKITTATTPAYEIANGPGGSSFSASSGTQKCVQIKMNGINQSGTAAYTMLELNTGTETSTGSGAKLLIDAQVAGTSKFRINNAGVPGFNGQAPPTVQTYSVTNAMVDRSYDADTTNAFELADVVATLIDDLRQYGLVL